MNDSNHDNAKVRSARTIGVGAVVATVCVMGLVGAILLHPENPTTQFAGNTQSGPTATPAPTETAFLHAPATDSGIPSADQVFASRRRTPDDDAPAAPTF